MKEKKWHLDLFGRKEHMGWREGPWHEYRHGIFMAYFHQSVEDPGKGLLIWHQLNLISSVSPSPGPVRAGRGLPEGEEEGMMHGRPWPRLCLDAEE